GQRVLHIRRDLLAWHRVDRWFAHRQTEAGQRHDADANTATQLYATLRTAPHPRTDQRPMCNIRVIARVFDDTAGRLRLTDLPLDRRKSRSATNRQCNRDLVYRRALQ